MVEVELKKDLVTFKHQNAFLKLDLRIPLENIDSVSTETVTPLRWTGEGKVFYYVKNISKCIMLKLKDCEYSKVVIEVDDKERVAQILRESIKPPPKFSLREYTQLRKVSDIQKSSQK